jgi:hypothetical protein
MTKPRASYEPLTQEDIDVMAMALLNQHELYPLTPGRIKRLCAMAGNALLYVEEIERLRTQSAGTAFKDGIEAAAIYCERTLAGNHPSLAHAYRHAATNIRAFADFNAAPQAPGSSASTGADGEGAVSRSSGEPLSPASPIARPAEAASTPRSASGRSEIEVEESTDSIGDWQCKGYADDWITFPTRKAAERYQESTGALMRYVRFYHHTTTRRAKDV